MTPGIYLAIANRKRHKLSNIAVDTSKEWSNKISDEEIAVISDEQKAALSELKEQGVVFIPLRINGASEIDMRRSKIFKTLVYKDLCRISVNGGKYWVYFDRDFMGRF